MNQLRVIGLTVALVVGVLSWIATCAAWQFDEVAAGFLPLPTRTFERFTVITLGTGGAHENPNRRGPATAIGVAETIWLVDAGRGVADGLRAAGVPVSQPEAVLLTSLLPENLVGLDDLLSTSWLEGRRERLRLLGPPGTRRLARAVEETVIPGLRARADALEIPLGSPGFEVQEIDESWQESVETLRVGAGELPGGPIPALAYRAEWRGRAVVISGTGWAQEALVEYAQGAQTLIHEATFVPSPQQAKEAGIDANPDHLRREAAFHTTLEAVGGLASRAGVAQLVLVRLHPPPVYDLQITQIVDNDYEGSILIPEDGEEITP